MRMLILLAGTQHAAERMTPPEPSSGRLTGQLGDLDADISSFRNWLQAQR